MTVAFLSSCIHCCGTSTHRVTMLNGTIEIVLTMAYILILKINSSFLFFFTYIFCLTVCESLLLMRCMHYSTGGQMWNFCLPMQKSQGHTFDFFCTTLLCLLPHQLWDEDICLHMAEFGLFYGTAAKENTTMISISMTSCRCL